MCGRIGQVGLVATMTDVSAYIEGFLTGFVVTWLVFLVLGIIWLVFRKEEK